MTLRRGFGEEAKRLALELRAELGLNAYERLDPRDLARRYGISIYALTDMEAYGCAPETLAYFGNDDRATFSAALVPYGSARLIIENDCHSDGRRRASLAHELAHVLLEHPFGAAILGPDGCRAVDRNVEEEADRLGGELVIPFKAAMALAKRGSSDNEVARRYGVSPSYAAMRMNASGARKIIARSRASRAGQN